MPSFNEQHPDPLAHAIARDKFIADRARTEAIDEALYDAICDGEGRPRPDALARHLAKHGLVIVEAVMLDRTTIPAEPRMIHAGGALDHAAIAAEIERRMTGRKAWQRDMIEAKVMDLASQQRWPILEAAVEAEWTAAERAEFDRLSRRAFMQSISMRGNTNFEALARDADAIADTVRRRAAAKMVAAGKVPAMQQAAE